MIAVPRASRCFQPPDRFFGQFLFPTFESGHVQDVLLALAQAFSADAIDATEEVEVLVDGHVVVEAEFLAHVADPLADVIDLADGVETEDRGSTGGGADQAKQHTHGGRFTGAVGSQEAKNLATGIGQIDMIHGHEIAEFLGQVLCLDSHCLRGAHASTSSVTRPIP